MAKLRIYEIAKELGVTSKDIIEHLNTKGIDKHSPNNALEDSEVDALKSHFGGASKPKKEAESPKAEKAEESKKADKASETENKEAAADKGQMERPKKK